LMCTTITNYENFESFVKTPTVTIRDVMGRIRFQLSAPPIKKAVSSMVA